MTLRPEALVGAFDKFTDQMEAHYKTVRSLMAEGRYQEAHQAMANTAIINARAALSMRNTLIKHNLIKEED